MIFSQNYSASSSFWQSDSWREILTGAGQCREAYWERLSQERKILIEVRSIGLSSFGAFSIGVTVDLSDADIMTLCVSARKRGCLFLQIEPLLGHIEKIGISPYRHFLEPYTRTLDLSLSETDLLTQMHEKGRYNIRLAQKRGVTAEWVPPTSANIDIWMQLLMDTTSRDRFSHNPQKYYELFLQTIETHHQGGLLLAYFEGKVIAAGIFVYAGDQAIYYYGASSSDREIRKHMAPYLLQWEAIREGKRRDCQIYDFLGIADPEEKNSHLRGVTEFKEKFGGEVVKLQTKKLFPLSWKYSIFLFLRNIKKILSK